MRADLVRRAMVSSSLADYVGNLTYEACACPPMSEPGPHRIVLEAYRAEELS